MKRTIEQIVLGIQPINWQTERDKASEAYWDAKKAIVHRPPNWQAVRAAETAKQLRRKQRPR